MRVKSRSLSNNTDENASLIDGDVGDENFCQEVVKQTIDEFGKIDILVNNAAEQPPKDSIEKIREKQLVRTFRTNIFSMFFLTKATMKHLKKGSAIINTTSVTATKASPFIHGLTRWIAAGDENMFDPWGGISFT
jgi:NAD(P)-dependent dehydrogenase (short-subunit alcohol dehydrogenase family)